MNSVALICTAHDPTGKNVELLKATSKILNKVYSKLFVTVSDETDKALIDELKKSNFEIRIIPKKGAAYARREVVKLGLSSNNKFFHYCDFDRLLTWVSKYSEELEKMVFEMNEKECSSYDYLILGRTERAFNTHPTEWVETEKITNKIFSIELGKDADVTAGSCGFSRICAEYIREYSKDKMTDAEWPMIIHRIAKLRVDYKAVEGLEYHEKVNGYSKQVEDSEKWFGRVRLCYIISESAINTGKNEKK